MQRFEFSVERCDESGLTVIVPVELTCGDWVRFEDAAKLQNRIDELESMLEEIQA